MQTDQAARLRLLVDDEFSSDDAAAPRAWRTLRVMGAKGGVGTSTVALNLAVALSMAGCRVELASRDDLRATECCLEPGPAGVALRHAAAWQSFCSASRHGVWPRQPRELPDWLVADVGCCHADALPTDTSEAAIIVTTPEPVSILAAFAAVRQAYEYDVSAGVVINRARSMTDSRLARARFQDASRRLLGRCPAVHLLSEDPAVLDAARIARPVALTRPSGAFSRGIQQLVDTWISARYERVA